MRARRKRWRVNHRVRFKNLALSKRIREAADQGDNAPIRFGNRYTVIMRGGRAVLHLLSDYYTDAVLEAAQDEDIEPIVPGDIPRRSSSFLAICTWAK